MFTTSNPKQPFYVANQIQLFPQDQEVLIKLYQPLIGARSVALYQTLIADYDPRGILSDARGIYALQEQVDCGTKDLFNELHKLEATGLVQTFLVDNKVNQVLAFRLTKVPSAREFFSTELLASYLKEKVGPAIFHDLSRYFAKKAQRAQKPIKNGTNVSANFWEVFHLPQEEAITPSSDVLQARQENNQTQETAKAHVNQNDHIDWDFIKQQFNIYQVMPGEVDKHKEQIRSLMQTYGLTEQDFINESLLTLHGASRLDLPKISKLLAANYRAEKTRHQIQAEIAKNEHLKAVPQDIPAAQRKLWQEANRLSPAEFLYKIKQARQGFASPEEKSTVNYLHSQIGLPVDLVNILIYACLQERSSISFNYANAVANDWMQHGVTNSALAIKYLEKRKQNFLQRSSRRSFYPAKKHVEQGTDWKKKKAKVDKKVNPTELKRFFKNLEDQNGMK